MPEFRHQPEWQQQADRGSPLTDPVITVRQLSRFDSIGGRRAAGRFDHALVFVTGQGGYDAYVPPLRPSRAEVVARRYTAVYEVDTGIHPVQLIQTLPSRGDAFHFEATVDLTWQVAAPDRVVASGLRDVPATLTPRVQQRMRAASRRFAIEDSAAAETAVQDALDAVPLADTEGLEVICSVRLGLDEAARAHQERLRAIRYDTAAAVPEHEYQQLRLRQEQELLAKKAEFYRYHLDQGGVAQWALQLAQHPDDLPRALESLRADQVELLRNKIHLFDRMVENKQLEQYQLEEPAQLVLSTVRELLAQQQTGLLPPSAPAAPLPAGQVELAKDPVALGPDEPYDAPPAPPV